MTVNTATLFNLKVNQLKRKKYLTPKKGITYNLNDEITEIISIICKGKISTDLVFAKQIKDNVSRYSYYLNFKDICAELNIHNASIDSWRRTFGYHHYLAHKEYIDVHEPMSAGFREGLNF